MSNLRNLFKLVAVATVVAGVVAEVDDGVLDEPVAACDPGVGVAIIDGFTVRYTPSDGTCKTGFTLVNTDVNTDCLHTIPDGATIATEGSGFKIEGDAAFDALLARAFDGQISAGGETLIFGATGKELKVWDLVDQEPLGGTNCADGQTGKTALEEAIQAEAEVLALSNQKTRAATALVDATAAQATSTDMQTASNAYTSGIVVAASDSKYDDYADVGTATADAIDAKAALNAKMDLIGTLFQETQSAQTNADAAVTSSAAEVEADVAVNAASLATTAAADLAELETALDLANTALADQMLIAETAIQAIADAAAAQAAAAAAQEWADALGFADAATHQLAVSWYSGDGVAFTMGLTIGAKDLYDKHKDMFSKSYSAGEEGEYDDHVEFYDDLLTLNDGGVASAALGSFEGKAQYAYDKSVFDAHSYGFDWSDGDGNSALVTYTAAADWYANTDGYTAPTLGAGYADQYNSDRTDHADAAAAQATAVGLGFVDTADGGSTAAQKHQLAITFYAANTQYVPTQDATYAAQYATDKEEVDLAADVAQMTANAGDAFAVGTVHMKIGGPNSDTQKYIVTGFSDKNGQAGVEIKKCPGGGTVEVPVYDQFGNSASTTSQDAHLAAVVDDAQCQSTNLDSVDIDTPGNSLSCFTGDPALGDNYDRSICDLYTLAELQAKETEAEATEMGQLVLLQEAVAAGISDADKLALQGYADAAEVDAINTALASAASGFTQPDGTSIEGLTALLTKINAIDAAIGSNDSEGLKLKIKSLENALSGIDLSGITDNSNAASTNAVAIGTNAATIAAATAARASLETTLKDLDAVIQTDVDQNEADADTAIGTNAAAIAAATAARASLETTLKDLDAVIQTDVDQNEADADTAIGTNAAAIAAATAARASLETTLKDLDAVIQTDVDQNEADADTAIGTNAAAIAAATAARASLETTLKDLDAVIQTDVDQNEADADTAIGTNAAAIAAATAARASLETTLKDLDAVIQTDVDQNEADADTAIGTNAAAIAAATAARASLETTLKDLDAVIQTDVDQNEADADTAIGTNAAAIAAATAARASLETTLKDLDAVIQTDVDQNEADADTAIGTNAAAIAAATAARASLETTLKDLDAVIQTDVDQNEADADTAIGTNAAAIAAATAARASLETTLKDLDAVIQTDVDQNEADADTAIGTNAAAIAAATAARASLETTLKDLDAVIQTDVDQNEADADTAIGTNAAAIAAATAARASLETTLKDLDAVIQTDVDQNEADADTAIGTNAAAIAAATAARASLETTLKDLDAVIQTDVDQNEADADTAIGTNAAAIAAATAARASLETTLKDLDAVIQTDVDQNEADADTAIGTNAAAIAAATAARASLETTLKDLDAVIQTDVDQNEADADTAIGTNAAAIAAATAARASLETTLKDLDAVIQTDVDQNEADADTAIGTNAAAIAAATAARASLETTLKDLDAVIQTDVDQNEADADTAIGTNAAAIAAATAARASLETTLKDLDAVIQTDVDQNEMDADKDIHDITKQGGHIDVDVAKLKSDLLDGATELTTFKSVEEAIEALRVSISDQIAQMTTAFTSWTKATCDGWSADLDLAKSERILKNNYAAMRELYEQGTGSCGEWGR